MGSFLVSYARAKAETLGLRGDVGLGSRAERVVVIMAGLILGPWGGLQWAIYLLTVTAWMTVFQRMLYVRRQLHGRERSNSGHRKYAIVLALDVIAQLARDVIVRMPPGLKRRLAGGGRAARQEPERPRRRHPRRPLRRRGRGRAAAGNSPGGGAAWWSCACRPELKETLAAPSPRSGSTTINDLIVDTLRRRRSEDGKETMAPTNGKARRDDGQGPRRDHRRRQLRVLARAGRRVLPGRRTGRLRPRADARRPRRLPHPRHRVHRGVRHRRRTRSARTSPRRSGPRPNNTVKFADVPKTGITVSRGMTHDGLGKYLSEIITKAPGETDDIVKILQGHGDRRRRQLPAGRLRGGDEVVRRADPRTPAARW